MWYLVFIPAKEATLTFFSAISSILTVLIAPAIGYLITGAIDRLGGMISLIDSPLAIVAFLLAYVLEGSLRLVFCWVIWII